MFQIKVIRFFWQNEAYFNFLLALMHVYANKIVYSISSGEKMSF